MKEDREKADLVVHLVGENEIERAHVRQVLETVTEPRLEVIDFAPDSATHHPAKPDAVLVQIEENPAVGLAYLNRLSERPNKPFLVGLLRDEGAAMMRQVLHAGADELLPVPLDADEAMLLFLKLKERDQSGNALSKIGKLYSVAGLAGGVGVSTIAANLGLAMRYELGRRVAIVDLDLQNGGVALKMHLNPEQTIMPLLDSYRRLDSIKLEAALTKHPSGIYVLAAPKKIEDADLVSDLAVAPVLDLMRQLFDVVIVDCGRRVNENAVAAWERSSEVLYVIDQSLWAARRMPRFTQLFDSLGLRNLSPRLIVNRFEAAAGVRLTALEQAAETSVFGVIPREPKSMDRLQLHAEDLWQFAPASRLAQAFAKLAHDVEIPEDASVRAPGLVTRLWSSISALVE